MENSSRTCAGRTKKIAQWKKATRWLAENNFYYGQRSFFNYKDNAQEWCHRRDVSREFIDVDIAEYKIDTMTASQYRDFLPDLAPWVKAAIEDAKSENQL